MEHEFWHQRWRDNEIGFHEGQPNDLLTKHFQKLQLGAGARIFMPLCGKSHDIHWLLQQGFKVSGAELSEIAVKQLFADLGVAPEIDQLRDLKKYRGPDLEIFVGDVFDLLPEFLGPIDALYDRAALVALPPAMRPEYAAQMIKLVHSAPQLLVSFDYDQSKQDGPPFSVPESEIRSLYHTAYEITLLESQELEGGLKGKVEAREQIWLMSAL